MELRLICFTVIAALAMSAVADDVELPSDLLCSLDGDGSVTLNVSKGKTFIDSSQGSVQMHRVNGTVAYEIETEGAKGEFSVTIMLRPDLANSGRFLVQYNKNPFWDPYVHVTCVTSPMENMDYNYRGIKNVGGKDYHYFLNLMGHFGMLFTTDGYMNLAGEYISLKFDNNGRNRTIYTLEFYIMYNDVNGRWDETPSDDFMITDPNSQCENGTETPAKYAVSSGCLPILKLPVDKLCGMQAKGAFGLITLSDDSKRSIFSRPNGDDWIFQGAVSVKRANTTARFDYDTKKISNGEPSSLKMTVLVRPDADSVFYDVKTSPKGSIPVGCNLSSRIVSYDKYQYYGLLCPEETPEFYHAFAYFDGEDNPTAYMLFTRDKNLNLAQEVYMDSFEQSKDTYIYLTVQYSGTEKYLHSKIDDAFSSENCKYAKTNAPWASTKDCHGIDSSDASTTKSSLLALMMMAFAIFIIF